MRPVAGAIREQPAQGVALVGHGAGHVAREHVVLAVVHDHVVEVVAPRRNAKVRVDEDLIEAVEEVVLLGEDAAVRSDVERQDVALVQGHWRGRKDNDKRGREDVHEPVVLLRRPQRQRPDRPEERDDREKAVDHELDADVVPRVHAPGREQAAHRPGQREEALVAGRGEVAVVRHLVPVALHHFIVRVPGSLVGHSFDREHFGRRRLFFELLLRGHRTRRHA